MVVLFRRLKCLHVYECVSQGRQWWYSLHLTTDTRFTLREMQPSFQARQDPYPTWWQHGAGQPYPRGVGGAISNDVLGVSPNHQTSVIVKRDASDHRNMVPAPLPTTTQPKVSFAACPPSPTHAPPPCSVHVFILLN